MKSSTVVVLALAAAAGLYFVHEAATGIPSGYGSALMVPGAFSTPTPANGQLAFVLPKGATWVQAARFSVGSATTTAVQVPAGNAPLLAAAVAPSQAWALVWKDANGATQTTAVTLT
jgi:hypothetical protein